jgi:hypothetical protein
VPHFFFHREFVIIAINSSSVSHLASDYFVEIVVPSLLVLVRSFFFVSSPRSIDPTAVVYQPIRGKAVSRLKTAICAGHAPRFRKQMKYRRVAAEQRIALKKSGH